MMWRVTKMGNSMRNTLIVLFSVLACGSMTSASFAAEQGPVQIVIQSPSADFTASEGETTVEVEGIASAIGGVRYIDMIFVMDTSTSLRDSDRSDFRSAGAVGLVENLSPRSDIKIGVVSFDSKGDLVQPMTSERGMVVAALQSLQRSGSTNLAAGIQTAIKELEKNGRPGSSRVIMLFTDGMSNERTAYDAAVRAQEQGSVTQTLLLGSSKKGS